MLKKTYKILNIFAKEPWKRFTFKDIKKISKSKSESYVYNTLKNFVKEGILKQENAGNVVIYSLNNNTKAIINSANSIEYESWQKKQISYRDMEELMNKIPTNFFTFIITGSYANNKQTAKSDIDVVILCKEDSKKIYAELKHLCDSNIPPIHLYVFKESEFMQMLTDKKSNYGKETVKNNLILYGTEAYYRVIFEAMENGFNG
ncbi:MAG: nucleotidyltransferase domain-containing protein [Nanoarchaeota archaeon]|nr:nucleotidyltransferase domain-containing protein [Nanoarchaeota archaeon]